jgi:transcription elongation factor GreA
MTGKETVFTIVGPNEAEPAKGRISNESPLGVALQGKKVGDIASVRTPNGNKKVKILSVG